MASINTPRGTIFARTEAEVQQLLGQGAITQQEFDELIAAVQGELPFADRRGGQDTPIVTTPQPQAFVPPAGGGGLVEGPSGGFQTLPDQQGSFQAPGTQAQAGPGSPSIGSIVELVTGQVIRVTGFTVGGGISGEVLNSGRGRIPVQTIVSVPVSNIQRIVPPSQLDASGNPEFRADGTLQRTGAAVNIPPTGDTGSGDPQLSGTGPLAGLSNSQIDQLGDVLTRINNGDFQGAAFSNILSVIRFITGGDEANARAIFSASFDVEGRISDEARAGINGLPSSTIFQGEDPDANVTIVPTPIPTGPLEDDPNDPAFRFDPSDFTDDIVRRQVSQDVFGDLGGAAQASVARRFGEFQDIDRLTSGLLPPDEQRTRAEAFKDFLTGGRLTGGQLGTNLSLDLLRAIEGADLGQGGGPNDFSARFQGLFTNQDASPFGTIAPAARAALQPRLAGISPRFQGGFGDFAFNEFKDRFARNPESFGTAFDVFQDFQRRNFFPTARTVSG